jgi:hypothetical protein
MFYRRLVAAAEVVLGPVHPAVVDMRNSHIWTCGWMEHREGAVRACEQALAIAEANPDPGQESAIRYRSWLSNLYGLAGQYEKAEHVYDNLTLCPHLQPVLDALKASGAKIRQVRTQGSWRRFFISVALDCEELINRLGLAECVETRAEDFTCRSGHDNEPRADDIRKGLVCREDDHGLFNVGWIETRFQLPPEPPKNA